VNGSLINNSKSLILLNATHQMAYIVDRDLIQLNNTVPFDCFKSCIIYLISKNVAGDVKIIEFMALNDKKVVYIWGNTQKKIGLLKLDTTVKESSNQVAIIPLQIKSMQEEKMKQVMMQC